MSVKNTLLKSVFVILSGAIAVRLIKVVFTPLLVRVISQAQYGTFASVMAVFTIIGLVSNLGLFDSIRKHVAEFQLGSQEQTELVASGVLLATVYGVVGTVVMILLSYLPIGLGEENKVYLLILSLAVLPKNLFSVFRGAFYGRQQEQKVEVLLVSREIIYVVIGLLLAATDLNLTGVFVGYLLAVYSTMFVSGWMVYGEFEIHPSQVLSSVRERSIKVARYGGAQAIGGVAAMLLYQADVLLVNYFQTATETGLYKAALIPAQFIWIVPTGIQMALLQNASEHYAEGRIDMITTNVRNGLRYAFLALTLFGVGLYSLSDEFLAVYFGPGFQGSVLPLQILIVGSFFLGLNRILAPVLQSTGWIMQSQLVSVVGLFLNIVLNILLIPRYGIVGAALATSISYISIFFGGLIVWHFTEFGYLRGRTILSLVTVLLVFVLLYLPLANAFDFSNFIDLFILSPLGAVLFLAICIITNVVESSEYRRVYAYISSQIT